MFEFDPCICDGEAPVDGRFHLIAFGFPVPDFLLDDCRSVEAAIETLAMQNTQLCFRHVQPTAVFGRGVDLQPPRQAARLRGAKRLIEGRNRMRVQVVLHQPHTQGLRVDLLQEHADTSGPVHLGAPVADEDLAPPTARFHEQEQITDPFAFVLIVIAGRRPFTHGPWDPRLSNQLLTEFIHTHQGASGIIGQLVQFQQILHPGDERRIGGWWKTPRLLLPWDHRVFFSTCRTVSWDNAPYPATTRRFAMSRTVQRFRPRGGSPFATSMMWAAAWASTLYALYGRGRGCKAAAKPSSTNRWRTRATVRRLTPKVSAICWSVRRNPSTSWSAYRRIRAWFSLRAAALPDASILRTCARSSSVSVTLYVLCPGMVDLLLGSSKFLDHQKHADGHHTSQSKFDRAVAATWNFTRIVLSPLTRASSGYGALGCHTRQPKVYGLKSIYTQSVYRGFSRTKTYSLFSPVGHRGAFFLVTLCRV